MSRAVLLLKSPPRIAEDPYQKLIQAEGYYPVFVEVLESVLSNEKKLEDILSSEPLGMYRGVVVTSSRSAEAWIRTLEHTSKDCGNWSDIPFYVVGESTARALEPMTISHPSKFSKRLILGMHAGKAELLAYFILDDLRTRQMAGKLLYLTGDKNRDTFSRIMNEHDIPIDSLMVYETGAASDLERRIAFAAQTINDRCPDDNMNSSVWIIFFAPSSSGFALTYLKQHFSLPQTDSSDKVMLQDSAPRSVKLAAIGTTTFEFLTNQAHLRVDAVPVKPTAEDLVASIKEFDRKSEVALT
ncbi:hypothetical protein Clacol_000260 [Clathrus columnatus]|uniref:Tetrapyrrole biosynthesis uroporphyrinogen III synthase domain-containing protein n=1 Tax=Clathrus columnatus TaxID=1419009 RepID=A0AAV4ZZ92_9AGAM|nr:hypothetical protein Clacol_000260 [Clathrus columnatus]